MSVIVTPDNYVEGYDIIEVGSEFEDSFLNYNTIPYGTVNQLLSVLSNERQRITDKVVNKAISLAQTIASRNGWNAVLNFDIEYEEVGEWAGLHCVCVHVYGILCYIEPRW